MRKRLKVQIVDHHHWWHSETHFLSYPAKWLLKAFIRVACNNSFLLLWSTLQRVRQRHDASEHFLSLCIHMHMYTYPSRWKQVCLLNRDWEQECVLYPFLCNSASSNTSCSSILLSVRQLTSPISWLLL